MPATRGGRAAAAGGRPVRITTPLGEDLLFSSMELDEQLGRLFRCQLELLSPREDIDLNDLLAQEMTIELELPGGARRYLHGYVSEMAQLGRVGSYVNYAVTLRPWLWFLTRTADCRIFQEKTVPEIIKEVFRENGFSDFKEMLSAQYRRWEYCVQYRETDFNFVSRLMEQEGIYYFFEHEDGKDTVVLADSPSAHSRTPGYEKIPYYPPSPNVVREEHIFDWRLSKSVQPGAYGIGAYHFKKPRASLEAYSSIAFPHARSDYELFDYPGEHYEKDEGDRYANVRMEELAAKHERVTGLTDAKGLFPGALFELTEHPRADQNREYLVLAARHVLRVGLYESGDAGGEDYSCAFEAIPSDIAYRPERITPRPTVQGPQTATVVGKQGEEIDTDEYGRVKVQFHWDRYGKSDEKSSCWVRVAQIWAGSQWGGITIPRIGQEVIVDFIEGDPDRPIITGRVYNADNMPPYALPQNKTQSGIKSRSTKGGGPDNFNEIRFEDKLGQEEVYIHAERDFTLVVENNQTITVGFEDKDPGDRSESIFNDRTLSVGRDKIETVGRNKQIQVDGAHAEQIGAGMTINVGGSLTETVAVNYAETVGAAMELTVGGLLAITVGAAMSETVGGAKSENVGLQKTEAVAQNRSLMVGKDASEKIGGSKAVEIVKDSKLSVGGKRELNVTKEYIVNAQKLQLVAKDEILLKVGSAQITMKKNGDITIKGNKINVNGSGDVVIKGSQIKQN